LAPRLPTATRSSAAQWLDDAAGTVTRHIANGWLGERLADWTGSGSNLRIYGTNGHHDVTWLATSTGTVSQALRYDPWGNPRPGSAPSGYTPFRFQGAWFDATTSLNWVITRWYAQSLGRFISEDTLLGTPTNPPSRHLYAYAAGEPIARWDPDGRVPVPSRLIHEETIELPNWYGLVWWVAGTYACAWAFWRRGFTGKGAGVGTALCDGGLSQQPTKSDRARQRIFATPYSVGATTYIGGATRDKWPGDNVYTIKRVWAYWIRTVNDQLIYVGSYSEQFKANQRIVNAVVNRCSFKNTTNGFSMEDSCLGLWR